ncbi:protein of unknown function [Candidatus Nitrosocosmicus franklandus]|uniref:Uncharacterized protein n=1 Tax=Candidatus Nitrosocosmicus franklandianus TaxID=1798806 RepID=A0A484IFE2_9ARCH|nr:protein of unknown function [Candidatus Nitrosocosmicus franklandus]
MSKLSEKNTMKQNSINMLSVTHILILTYYNVFLALRYLDA